MTRNEAIKQSAAYRKAADTYARQGDAFVAERLKDLANRLDAKIAAK